jgi:hypothetical protein
VARAQGAPASTLVREAAAALAGLGDDPAAVVTSCRRLVDRHPGLGPMWWLSARVLCSADPEGEAWLAAAELDADQTPSALAVQLPDSATVVVVGWPDQAAGALRRRGDVRALALRDEAAAAMRSAGGRRRGGLDVSTGGQARRSRSPRLELVEVPWSGAGSAVSAASLVLVDAEALGPSGVVAETGSLAAAAAGQALGVEVWAIAGVGRVLPPRLWEALLARHGGDGDEPWERECEFVSSELVDKVVGPTGLEDWTSALRRAACPVAPELLRPV